MLSGNFRAKPIYPGKARISESGSTEMKQPRNPHKRSEPLRQGRIARDTESSSESTVPSIITSSITHTHTQALTFQQLLFRLQTFWADRGCVLQQPYDVEVGAGTMSPDTFLRVLGSRPINIAYVQPSRRPADGRYGENPNRLYKHTQFQVILKPPPSDIQEVYLASLEAIGIDLSEHDIKFEEDNWESPTLGAWGIGWQVMLDGLEVTQFTYFQQCGGLDLDPISGEITYGLERLAAFLQDVDSIYDIVWARDPRTGRAITYGEIRLEEELQFSVYNFEAAEVDKLWEHLRLYEAECQALLSSYADSFSPKAEKQGERQQQHHDQLIHGDNAGPAGEDLHFRQRRFPVLGAYDLCLKCSHLFNLLDARGAISVTERVGVIARIRALAVGVARAYAGQQQSQPLVIS
jgi:glycyl-tRNA synthetase alpha chain